MPATALVDRFLGDLSRALVLCCLVLGAHAAEADTSDPCASAVALWRFHTMTGDKDQNPLVAVGDAQVGVALAGEEREVALRAGGDGQVARLGGGYLDAGQGSNGGLNLSAPALTVAMRLRSPSGTWGGPLFSKHGGHDQLVYNIYSTPETIGLEIGTQQTPQQTQVQVPVARIGERDWHLIIGRYDGATLQLFVDGVWMDEGFPMGALRTGNTVPCLIGAEAINGAITSGWKGDISLIALWDRALSDAEITRLSGGSEQVARRHAAYIGDLPCLQYWKPQDPFNVGDTLPFFHDGVFHFVYLLDHGHHTAKNGRGAHQWAQATSTDLIHWQDYPLAIPITDAGEGSICTGSVFVNDGTYRAFYATRGLDRQERLSLAVGTDGEHFAKTLPNPFLVAGPRYTGGFRDPFVFRVKDQGPFHLIVSTTLASDHSACLAQYLSSDLTEWTETDPLIIEAQKEVPECPDCFFWKDWYYLLFSYHQVAHYRMSREPLGPWITPTVDIIDGAQARVMKTAPFTGDRRIGTVSIWPHGYAGWAIFRELVQNSDGTLGSRFVPEMIPQGTGAVAITTAPLSAGVTGDSHALTLAAQAGPASVALTGVPPNARIHCRLAAAGGALTIGVRDSGAGQAGTIRIDPAERSLTVAATARLTDVSGLDHEVTLDVVLTGRLMDLCINNQRTLISWLGEATGNRLVLTAEHGTLHCDQIEVIALP